MHRSDFLLVLAIALTCGAPARANSLNAPFDPDYARQVAGKPAAAFTCREVPQPTLDMSGLESRYVKNDPTQSKVDPAKAAREAARGKVLWDYILQIGRMADQFMLSSPPRPELSDCAVQYLAAWARAGALTQNIEQNHEIGRHQAIMLQAWSLAGLTFAYMKLGDRRTDPSPADRDIRQWFKVLSDSVVNEYSNRASVWYQKRASNHGLWAGLAVANAGVILNDSRKLEFGRALLHDALATVAADGSLPEEMARGDRAMLYQHFATMAVMGLVAVTGSNGRELSGTEQQALLRLLRFDIDPSRNSSGANGQPGSKLPKYADKSALAWSEIAVCYLNSRDSELAARIDDYVKTLRPMIHAYYGGNATAAFNPASLRHAGDGTRRCPSRGY